MDVPTPHLGLMAAGIAGAVLAALVLPAAWGRWRRRAAVAVAGLVVAGVAGVTGLAPWWGSMHLAWHGVLMAAGFAAAYMVSLPRVRRLGVPERDLVDLTLIALIAGLIGARARYVWERPAEFAGSDWLAKAADFDGGGMVWYGGAILAGVLMAVLAWRRRLPARALADILLPACLLGLAIGRVGCFINGCCWGARCDLPWAVSYHGALVHPAQLYETGVCLALFALLWWIPGQTRPGTRAMVGLIGYAVWRFLNEYLRDHTALVERDVLGLTLTTSQITSLWLIVAAAALFGWWRWSDRRQAKLAATPR
jgi:phosphatidylglycerol:prolipoprotein diacylglycerol transferase